MSDPQFATALELATYFNGTTDIADLEPEFIAQANLLLQMIAADIEAAAGIVFKAGARTASLLLPLVPRIEKVQRLAHHGIEVRPDLLAGLTAAVGPVGDSAVVGVADGDGALHRPPSDGTGPCSTPRPSCRAPSA